MLVWMTAETKIVSDVSLIASGELRPRIRAGTYATTALTNVSMKCVRLSESTLRLVCE